MALNVSGRDVEAWTGEWPARACAARFCSGVAWMSANIFCLPGCEGRYLTLRGLEVGSCVHAVVRHSAHRSGVAVVEMTASFGVTRATFSVRCDIW